MSRLRLTEIFYSLQGETKTVGLPTVFVRLTGCPLRCHYCDTSYAFNGGNWYQFAEIIAEIKQYQTPYVTVTGGEPLAQKSCSLFLTQLCDLNYKVSLETSGALSIRTVDSRVTKILDVKTPASGEADKNLWENFSFLQATDQIKFVICNASDYQWAKLILKKYHLTERCHILFSPSHNQLPAGQLADWILQDRLAVRLQLQLHKYLWGDVRGR